MKFATEIENIEAYCLDTMDSTARAAFEKKMETNPDLRSEVLAYSKIFNSFDSLAQENLKQKMVNWESSQEIDVASNPIKSVPFGLKIATVAASLVLGLIVFKSLTTPGADPQTLFSQSFKPVETDYTSDRTIQFPEKELYNAGLAAYFEEDFVKSEELLTQYSSKVKTDNSVFLYLGISQLKNGKPEVAKTSLNKLNRAALGNEHVQWFVALCELKMNNLPVVKDSLNLIVKNPHHMHFDEAKRLLDRLD